ncbi:PIN domain-containing protein [Cyanobacterium aponinum AL20118]|uniref:Ribonuclease VapC n=1 Tax=Cyanobacterium aponinum AL20115 TaxID=3090662 RepID=A0AAF1C6C5_9CHRO|nr:PIN domain-containing protein [Cyanobacterium aponinum]WPF88644.1 PIN domain-containing protein [Cyanobacterium aponinum AL20115]
MYLIDTSVLVNIFRDKTGIKRKNLENIIQDNPFFLSHFIQMELLQGAKDEKEWQLLEIYLDDQDYLTENSSILIKSARIFYDLRRKGLTVRSTIDCCIAQLAISYNLILIHDDKDFETIKEVRDLQTIMFKN